MRVVIRPEISIYLTGGTPIKHKHNLLSLISPITEKASHEEGFPSGGAGSRTPVRREDIQDFYIRILPFDFACGNSGRRD